MGIAAIICFILAFLFWLITQHAIKRSKVPDGNIEGFLIFVYGPLAIATGVLGGVFSFIWIISQLLLR